MSRHYDPSPDESLASILNTYYWDGVSDEKQILIARNILFQNPELCIKLMPPNFWTKPGSLIGSDFHDVLFKRVDVLTNGIELPTRDELFHLEQSNYHLYTPESGGYTANPFQFHEVFIETSEKKVAFIIQEKILTEKMKEYAKKGGKLVGDTGKDTLEKAFELLKNDPVFIQSLGVTEISFKTFLNPDNIGKMFTKDNLKIFFEKMNAKIKIEMINGERYVTVYGNKEANGALKVLLEGAEKDAEIIALGFGKEAAKKIVKKVPYLTIVIVSSIDIKQYIFSKKEKLDDLFQNLGVDNVAALSTMLTNAFAAILVGGFLVATGFTLPIWGAVGLTIAVGFALEQIYEFFDDRLHITDSIRNSIAKIDALVSRELTLLAEHYTKYDIQDYQNKINEYQGRAALGNSSPFGF